MSLPDPLPADLPAAPPVRHLSGQVLAELVLLSMLWGGSFVLAKIALADIRPATLILIRVWLAAGMLAVVLRFKGTRWPRGRRTWAQLAVLALLNNVLPFSLIFSGQTLLPAPLVASLAAIVLAMTPIITVLVAHLVTSDERLDRAKLAGVIAGFAGVVILSLPALAGSAGLDTSGLLPGLVLCLGGAFVYAFASLYGRRFASAGLQPLQIAFGQLAMSSLIMVPVAAVADRPWTRAVPGLEAIMAAIAMALFATALAYILYFRILEKAGATNLTLVNFLIPVSTIAISVPFMGEKIGPAQMAGMVCIGLGLAAIDGRLARKVQAAAKRLKSAATRS